MMNGGPSSNNKVRQRSADEQDNDTTAAVPVIGSSEEEKEMAVSEDNDVESRGANHNHIHNNNGGHDDLATNDNPNHASNKGGDDNCQETTTTSETMLHAHRKNIFSILIVAIGAAASVAVLALGLVNAENTQAVQFEQRATDVAFSIEAVWNAYEIFGLWIKESSRAQQHVEEVGGPLAAKNATGDDDDDYYRKNNQTITIAQELGICERGRFHELYVHLLSSGFEFQSAQLVVNITDQQRKALEAESQAFYQSEYPNFDYKGIRGVDIDPSTGSSTTVTQKQQPFYVIVHYVEPFVGNEVVVDVNAYTRPTSVIAMEKAISTFRPVLTAPFKLVQETDPNAFGVILMHPGVPVNSSRNLPMALSQIVVRTPSLLARAAESASVSLSVSLYDSSNNNDEPTFFGGTNIVVHKSNRDKIVGLSSVTARGIDDLRASATRYEERVLSIADRQWTVAVTSLEGTFEPEIAYVILGGCLLFVASVVVAFWFHSSMKRLEQMNRLKSKNEAEKAALVLETTRRQTMAERQLNDFIAHEVRNPLSSAIAALSFVKASGEFTSDVATNSMIKEDLGTIDASLSFINELLRNMLDMHRAASKQMKLKVAYIDILHDVIEPVASVLYLRKSKVRVEIDCPESLVVLTDGLRVKQVVLNLTQNATKYVERGYILIRAAIVEGLVRICVEDSGPGIPESKQNQLFQKFQDSLDLLNQGTGVGLCLCKHLADLMGGNIYLDKNFDSGIPNCPGTRFVFDLRIPPSGDNVKSGMLLPSEQDDRSRHLTESSSSSQNVSQSVLKEQPDEFPEKLSVLFVDDDMIIRKMFIRTLKKVAPQWDIQEAASGEAAIHLIESNIAENGNALFQLIFLDQYMASAEKTLLGTETVRLLRSRGVQSTICGLSANDTEDDFIMAGADAFLLKPFPCEPRALKKEILRVLRKRCP